MVGNDLFLTYYGVICEPICLIIPALINLISNEQEKLPKILELTPPKVGGNSKSFKSMKQIDKQTDATYNE